jgi:predicted anti-sigma-YlaC factor YlaD
MNHQPFENWLLSEEPLPEENKHVLHEHLAACEQCRGLEDAWLDVANLFTEVPDIEPAPGFVNRWQTHLETERAATRAMRQRWQSWIVLVLIANGAAVAMLLLGVQLFNTYDSVTDFVLSWVYKAASALVLVNGFQSAFLTLFRTIPGLIPTSWWVGIAVILSVSTLFWIVSMNKLTSLPRRTT